jgi:glycolate oxidase iron-sulfur subunit
VLEGCVQRVVFGDVNAATARVLAADGWDVVSPRAQACCGALSIHAGRLGEGLGRIRRLIDVFDRAEVDLIVSNAAGCGSNLRDAVHLLAGDPEYAEKARRFSARVRDVSEVMADGPRALRHPLTVRVAFQDSCHLLHAQRVQSAPRQALTAIPGLDLAEPGEQELCCGSAGIYNMVQPEAAATLGRRKAERILETASEAYASANPGCLIQVTAQLRSAGRPLPAFHPVELVDASIRGLAVERLLAEARR